VSVYPLNQPSHACTLWKTGAIVWPLLWLLPVPARNCQTGQNCKSSTYFWDVPCAEPCDFCAWSFSMAFTSWICVRSVKEGWTASFVQFHWLMTGAVKKQLIQCQASRQQHTMLRNTYWNLRLKPETESRAQCPTGQVTLTYCTMRFTVRSQDLGIRISGLGSQVWVEPGGSSCLVHVHVRCMQGRR
jgi:hypothetical protein